MGQSPTVHRYGQLLSHLGILIVEKWEWDGILHILLVGEPLSMLVVKKGDGILHILAEPPRYVRAEDWVWSSTYILLPAAEPPSLKVKKWDGFLHVLPIAELTALASPL